jgi:putative ABC transport system permease protein
MLWTLTIREIRHRPGRALLTLMSIVIGVAAVVAVSLTAATTHKATAQMYHALAGRAALEVLGDGADGLEQSWVERLAAVPGVAAAVPAVQRFTVLYHGKVRLRLLAIGIDPASDSQVRDYQLAEGRFLQAGQDALLEAGFARGAGIAVADSVRLLTRRGMRTVKISGLLAPRGVAGFGQSGAIFLPLGTAQRLLGRPGTVDLVSLVLREGADEAAVRADIARQLPPGLAVRTTEARARIGKELFLNVERALQFGCTLTFLLATFIVLNTFLMNLGERRRALAILRAVGATRKQVRRMLLAEGAMMGLVGAVLGTPLGIAGAHLLLQAMAQLAASSPAPLEWTPLPFLLAAALGPGMAMAAVYFPARLAEKVSPMEGIRPVISQDRGSISWRGPALGIALFLASGLVLAACIGRLLPIAISIPSGAVLLTSFVLLIPAILPPLANAAIWLLRPLLGIEGELAGQELVRRRTRAGLTVGVLYIAIGMGVGLGTTITNNVQDVREWYRRTMQADFVVRAAFPDAATGMAAQMPESLGEQMRRLSGVRNVEAVRAVNTRVRDDRVLVIARDFNAPGPLPLVLADGDQEQLRQRLVAGEIALGTVLAQRCDANPGDSITVETAAGARSLRVAARVVEYTVGGLVICMHRAAAQRMFQAEGVDAFLIQARQESLAPLHQELAALCQQNGLMVHSFAELSLLLDGIMVGVLRGLWALLILGFVVAAFGIANTLMMNVLEQTRAIALLRVVGMTRWQVRKSILAQAAIIGLLSIPLGVIAGLNTAYIMSLCTQPLLGYHVPFIVQPVLVAGSCLLALLIVLLAAWIPAARATRLSLLIALQYE